MAAPYYGWYVVAACATIACFSWGFAFYGLGVYLHVLVRLHGWPTGTISVAVTACISRRSGSSRWKCSPSPGVLWVPARGCEAPRRALYLRGNCGPSGRRPS